MTAIYVFQTNTNLSGDVCSWKMSTNPPIFKDVETMMVEPDAAHDESVKGEMYF